MKIVHINSSSIGSTGTIMREIADEAKKNGHECYICYPKSRTNAINHQKGDIYIGNRITRNVGLFFSEILGLDFVGNFFSTFVFVVWLWRIRPGVVHLHNLHGSYINLPLLFIYLKKTGVKVVWTLHDCWAFTGHCPHYVEDKCEKWKTGCHNCPRYKEYPRCTYDNSKMLYCMKRKLFNSIKTTIVTPSEWLASQVQLSFLSNNMIKVIPNGINTKVFVPYHVGNGLKSLHEIPNKDNYFQLTLAEYPNVKTAIFNKKKILLAVASIWDKSKGLYDYLSLSENLSNEYILILVGNVPNSIILPCNIINIPRIHDKEILSALYNVADVVLSLSRCETFGMTIAEAQSCGTPVIVYNNTAQPELISHTSGMVVDNGDIKGVLKAIHEIVERGGTFDVGVYQNKFDKIVNYQKYISLYES